MAGAKVVVRCRGCGAPRELTQRQAARAGLCIHCLYPARVKVTDAGKRFWLRMFSDIDLADIGSDFIERRVRPEGIREQRVALLGSADLDETV